MRTLEIWQRAWRRWELLPHPGAWLRRAILRSRGARIGSGTHLPKIRVTWPHQIRLGRNCVLQPSVFFNFDHHWMPGPSILIGDRVFIGCGVEFNIQGRIEVGDDCLIASGCVLVDHDHGMDSSAPMNRQKSITSPIKLGRNVWVGARSVVLKGVTLGDGCVVGAGSVVTRSIPAGEVWAGNPARRLRTRAEAALPELAALLK
jgi:acetyltransferase-like isoleucine patch superfamily enzyme